MVIMQPMSVMRHHQLSLEGHYRGWQALSNWYMQEGCVVDDGWSVSLCCRDVSRVLLDDLEADLAASTPEEYREALFEEPILPPPPSHGQCQLEPTQSVCSPVINLLVKGIIGQSAPYILQNSHKLFSLLLMNKKSEIFIFGNQYLWAKVGLLSRF